MWLLFVIVATFVEANIQLIDRYVTEEECITKKTAFEGEFTASYPGDKDWAFLCLFASSKPTASPAEPDPAKPATPSEQEVKPNVKPSCKSGPAGENSETLPYGHAFDSATNGCA